MNVNEKVKDALQIDVNGDRIVHCVAGDDMGISVEELKAYAKQL